MENLLSRLRICNNYAIDNNNENDIEQRRRQRKPNTESIISYSAMVCFHLSFICFNWIIFSVPTLFLYKVCCYRYFSFIEIVRDALSGGGGGQMLFGETTLKCSKCVTLSLRRKIHKHHSEWLWNMHWRKISNVRHFECFNVQLFVFYGL